MFDLRTLPHRQGREMLRDAIVFDADDTLWVTEWLFDQAQQEAALVVGETGLDAEAWLTRMIAQDRENVAIYGFQPRRRGVSMVQTYDAMVIEQGGVPDPAVQRHLRIVSNSVFRRRAPNVGGAAEVLRALRRDHQIVVITKGATPVQWKRLKESGLLPLIDAVAVVDDKDSACFQQVCSDLSIDPRKAISVGNNLASDVEPAVKIGMHGVWIDAHVWSYERGRQQAGVTTPRTVKLDQLTDLPAYVASLKLNGHSLGEVA